MKRLTENTSNFSTPKHFSLYAFLSLEDTIAQYIDTGVTDEDEIADAISNSENTILTEEEIENLNADIEQFNDKTIEIANKWEDEAYITDETDDSLLNDSSLLINIMVDIKPGYHEGYQLAVVNEVMFDDFVSEDRKLEQLKRFGDFLSDIAKKYNIAKYKVAYRFSNGETGYTKITEKLEDNTAKPYIFKGTKGYLVKDGGKVKFLRNYTKKEVEDLGFKVLDENLLEAPDRWGIETDDEIDSDIEKQIKDLQAQAQKRKASARAKRDDIKQKEAQKGLDKGAKIKAEMFWQEHKSELEDLQEENDPKKLNKELFYLCVPESGKAETLGGEIVRALNRLVYRAYNDGDRFYLDYELDDSSCAGAVVFILNVLPRFKNDFQNIAGSYNDTIGSYANKLEKLTFKIEKYLLNSADGLFSEGNTKNYYDYKGKELEDILELPTLNIDLILPKQIIIADKENLLDDETLKDWIIEYLADGNSWTGDDFSISIGDDFITLWNVPFKYKNRLDELYDNLDGFDREDTDKNYLIKCLKDYLQDNQLNPIEFGIEF